MPSHKNKQAAELTEMLNKLQQNVIEINSEKRRLKKQQRNQPKQISKKDQKKILKLFKYTSWKAYVQWIDEKLQESGQTFHQQKQSEEEDISSEEDSENRGALNQMTGESESVNFELTEGSSQDREIYSSRQQEPNSSTTDKEKQQEELQLLALENGRLRRENIILKNRLLELKIALKDG